MTQVHTIHNYAVLLLSYPYHYDFLPGTLTTISLPRSLPDYFLSTLR